MVCRIVCSCLSAAAASDVTELAREPTNERTFGDWSMKYVPGERALGDLMRAWGMARFDPYALKPEQLDAAVTYLRKQVNAAHQLPDERSRSSFLSHARHGRKSRALAWLAPRVHDLKRAQDGLETNYVSATLGVYLSIYNDSSPC